MDLSHDLRPYQASAVSAVLSHWAAGRRRVAVVLPTGAGKTTVAARALASAGARRPLALVHTRTLRDQARRRVPGATVLTIQAALRAGRPLTEHDVVWIDECHHLASAAWVRVLSLLAPGVRIIGTTATPIRADGAALGTDGAGFDALVATAPYSALLRAGYLAPCDVVRPAPGLDAAGAYLAHGGSRPGILFAPSIAACDATVAALQAAGVRAATITAATTGRTRAARFAAFEAGELDLLASPMALSEGFDSPRAAVCVLDRPCVHSGVYLQTAGRVLRPHPTKTSATPAVLIDLHGASERHGHPLADRTYHLEGEPIRPAAPTRTARRPDAPRVTAPHRTPARATPRHRTAPHTAAHQSGVALGAALRAAATWLGRMWAA